MTNDIDSLVEIYGKGWKDTVGDSDVNPNSTWDGLDSVMPTVPEDAVTARQVAERYGITNDLARFRLLKLVSEGKLEVIKIGGKRYYRVVKGEAKPAA